MDGVIITPLKQICTPKGDVFHALKKSSDGFYGFGEAYFSTIKEGDIKGWKKHTEMVLNIIVPVGEIEFVLFDDRKESSSINEFLSIKLSKNNYQRLTIPNGVWVSFKGLSEKISMLLNIASIEHNPDESICIGLNEIAYEWS